MPIAATDGVIVPDQMYTFKAFKQLTGVGQAGIRQARRNGLEVKYWGRNGYVLGQVIIDFIQKNGKAER